MSESSAVQSVFARQALLPEGWRQDVRLVCGADGTFTSVAAHALPQAEDLSAEIVVPPLASLHSHAFQRAMAGMAELRQDPSDSFWTWRERMYGLALRVEPQAMRAIAGYLYMEMLKAGFGQVAEFHYLHRAPDGRAYDTPGEMALAIVAGARDAAIGLTMLPTLYRRAGFGRPLEARQRRFASTPDSIARIMEDIRRVEAPGVTIGVALHSLRAVSAEDITALLACVPRDCPVHIHVAEQTREVEECEAALGARAVRWLLDHAPVDERWCLVHATHLDAAECRDLARSGAVAGLCPITEANLGDGLFPLGAYLDEHGRFGVGSDSNVLISPAEELRLLEYGQRLATRTRARALPSGAVGSIGGFLYRRALAGGAQACGLKHVGLAVGARADLCVLDAKRLALPGLEGDALLDAMIFATPTLPVRDVLNAGQWVVRDGRHRHEAALTKEFHKAIAGLR